MKTTQVTVATGGRAGTLSEICFAWIHSIPIIVMDGHKGWAEQINGALAHREPSKIIHRFGVEKLETPSKKRDANNLRRLTQQ